MPTLFARVQQGAARPSTIAIVGLLLGVLAFLTAPGILRVLSALLLVALVVSVRACMADRSAKTIAMEEIATWSREVNGSTVDTTVSVEIAAAHTCALAGAANEVAGHVDEVAAAVEEFGASVREIAQSAAEAAQVTQASAERAANSLNLVERLSSSSTEIDRVIDLISEIAAQTNLLALNATIEAARAGSAGRGFAVVANEVKELAVQTGQATGDIRTRVEAIRGDAVAAASAIHEIAEVVQRIQALQSSIATAVEQQSAATDEVSRSVHSAASGTSTMAHEIGEVADRAYQATFGSSRSRRVALGIIKQAATSAGVEVPPAVAANPVEAAIAAHSDWKSRLINAIETRQSEIPVETAKKDDACAFGKWLTGPSAPRQRSDFEHVRSLHAHFHQEASTVLRLALAGESDQAHRLIAPGTEFATTSSQLVFALEGWRGHS